MLKIKGKFIKATTTQTGTSKAGKEWSKKSFVIDTGSQYNPEIAFGLFGVDKIALLQGIEQGQEIEVYFNLNSREYKGNYYTSADAWKIDTAADAALHNTADNVIPTEIDDNGLPF